MSLFAKVVERLCKAYIEHCADVCKLVIEKDTIRLNSISLNTPVMSLRVEEQVGDDFDHQIGGYDLLEAPDLVAHNYALAAYGEKRHNPFFKAISGLFVTAFDICYKVDISTQTYKYDKGSSSSTEVKFLGINRSGLWTLLTLTLYTDKDIPRYSTLLNNVGLKDRCYDTFVKKAGLDDWTTLTNAITEFMNIVPLGKWSKASHSVYCGNLPVGDKVTMQLIHGNTTYYMSIKDNPNEPAVGKSIDCLERCGVAKELVGVARTLSFIYTDTKPSLSFDVEDTELKHVNLLAHIAKKWTVTFSVV